MKVDIRFLDTERWSMYATLCTLVPLLLTLLAGQKVDLQSMVFMSVLCMMDGKLLPKIFLTGFLSFMVMEENVHWVIRSCIYVVSVIITHHIEYNNPVHRRVYTDPALNAVTKLLIIAWMLRIGYFILPSSTHIIQSSKGYSDNSR